MNIKSITKTIAFTIACSSITAFTACEKRSYRTYIHNDTDQGVSLQWDFNADGASKTLYIEAKETEEIPDIDRWNMAQHLHSDSVVFRFSNGNTVTHKHLREVDSSGAEHETFIPETNNILASDIDSNPSWLLDIDRHNTGHYHYHIKQ